MTATITMADGKLAFDGSGPCRLIITPTFPYLPHEYQLALIGFAIAGAQCPLLRHAHQVGGNHLFPAGAWMSYESYIERVRDATSSDWVEAIQALESKAMSEWITLPLVESWFDSQEVHGQPCQFQSAPVQKEGGI